MDTLWGPRAGPEPAGRTMSMISSEIFQVSRTILHRALTRASAHGEIMECTIAKIAASHNTTKFGARFGCNLQCDGATFHFSHTYGFKADPAFSLRAILVVTTVHRTPGSRILFLLA